MADYNEENVGFLKRIAENTERIAEALETLVESQLSADEEEEVLE